MEGIAAGSGAAWTLTGPFGTGKSAFCVVLSHLLSPTKDALSTELVRRFRHADTRLEELFLKNDRQRPKLHTATVSGASESLQAAVARALGAKGVSAALGLSAELTKH